MQAGNCAVRGLKQLHAGKGFQADMPQPTGQLRLFRFGGGKAPRKSANDKGLLQNAFFAKIALPKR